MLKKIASFTINHDTLCSLCATHSVSRRILRAKFPARRKLSAGIIWSMI